MSMPANAKITREQQFAILATCKRFSIKPKHPDSDGLVIIHRLARHFNISVATVKAIAGATPYNYKLAYLEWQRLGTDAMYEIYKSELGDW